MRHARTVLGTIGYLGGLPALLEEFCWAWGQLIQYNTEYLCGPGQIVHLARAKVSLHFFARNSLVEQTQGDWLFQTDTDHAPDPDLLVRMVHALNTYNVDVITALYRHRGEPGAPTIYEWSDVVAAAAGQKHDGQVFAMPIGNWDPDASLLQVGSAGGGALLVRKRVFDRIRAELHEMPFNMTPGYGEDHSFFLRCRKLGIKVYAMTRAESPHLSVTSALMKDYNFQDSAIDPHRFETEAFK